MENDDKVFCETCGEEYGDNSGVIEIWIGCDTHDNWYHCSCEGLRKLVHHLLTSRFVMIVITNFILRFNVAICNLYNRKSVTVINS